MDISDNNKQEEIMVSVICITYNHEKYIRDALDNFVNQETDFKYEVLIHDDASTDGTAEIVKSYAAKYPNLIKAVCQKENQYSQGVRISQKYLFPLARGRYMALCEGDDYWTDSHKLQTQVDFMEKHLEYPACATNSIVLNLTTGKTHLRNERQEAYDVTPDDVLTRIYLGKRQPWQLSGLLYRRKYAFERAAFMEKLTTAGDITLDLYLTAVGPVRFIPAVMSCYRMGTETSLLRQRSKAHEKMGRELIEMLQAYNEFTNNRFEKAVERLMRKLEYTEFQRLGNYEKVMSNKYHEFFSAESTSMKMKIYIKRYMPLVYTLYRQVKKQLG